MSEDMRKLINIVESYRNVLNEARIEDNPDVKYELAGATKAKTAAEEFSKITAFISGKTSELFTKLAKKFSEIDRLTKRIQQLRDEVNQEAKDQIDALFNAEDEVYTRYIETVSLSITMSKAIEEQRTQTSNLNVDAFITDVLALVGEDLQPTVEKLLEQHTKISTKIRAAQQGRVSVKIPESTLNESDVLAKVSNFVKGFAAKVMRWAEGYDSKLSNIAKRYNLH
jgi:uncharacterized protein YdcH (DUF465 family)